MTGTARRVQAARGRLARLVVAAAVLAGLGLAIGLQCTDAMATPMTHGADSADAARDCGPPATMAARHVQERVAPPASGQRTAACAAAGPARAFALAEGDAPGSDGLGGVLATCLAFILAVVAAVATLRPRRVRHVARTLRATRAVAIRAVRPRAPSLAQLCVLRT